MTDRDAILRNILEEPANDNHRLFAAWCEDDGGDPARAEFIRVQVELARIGPKPTCTSTATSCTNPKCVAWIRVGGEELRRREEELVRLKQFPELEVPVLLERWTGRGAYHPDAFATPHRGFISSVTCSWSYWLRHAATLYWHPGQTVECPKCVRGMCNDMDIGDITFNEWPCENCGGMSKDERGLPANIPGSGRIPRPFVATAQPLEIVRLTTWPDPIALNDTRPADAIYTSAGTFVPVKCPTCDGRGYNRRTDVYVDGVRQYNDAPGNTVECPQCHGTTPNRWTCDKWKGLEFEMPEAR